MARKKARSSLSVVVIDDHPLLVQGVSQLLALADDFEMLGSSNNVANGLTLIEEKRPDLVLLDLNMGEDSGLDLLKQLKLKDEPPKVIVLTVSNSAKDLRAALKAGANGYLLKDMEPEEILGKLRQAGSDEFVMGEGASMMLARVIQEPDEEVSREAANLTAREEEILRQIVTGHRNKVIGQKLNISDGTVKVHVKNLLRKINVSSRLEAAIWGLDNGYQSGQDEKSD